MIHAGRKGSFWRSGVLVLLLAAAILCHSCATRIDSGGPASVFLVSADEALTAGDYDQAELLLERALRVEPRRAAYWHAMGRVRFGQHHYEQAVQFCLKSISLAGKDGALIRKNYELIVQAYIRMGAPAKAEQARRKAVGKL